MSWPIKNLIIVSVLCAASVRGQFFFGNDDNRSVFETNPVPCFVPTGKAAFCVPLKKCEYVSDLVKNLQKPLPGDVALLLKDSFFCKRKNQDDDLEICCPLEGIKPPEETKPPLPDRRGCSTQTGHTSSCTVYNTCSPFLQLLSNLRRPVPRTLPSLMQKSWLCGVENVGGFNLPKICCPDDGILDEPPTPPPPTTTTTTASTTTLSPEEERLQSHPNRKFLAKEEDCGRQLVNPNIVGGQDADLGAYPWLANLGYTVGSRKQVDFKCGGALIGDLHVVTAAHCVTQLPGSFKLAKIRLGEHQISESQDCNNVGKCAPPPQDFDIAEVLFHQNYSKPHVFRNDIAVIKLSRPVQRNDFVEPICLPFEHESTDDYLDSISKGEDVFVAGWGATNERGRDPADTLQELQVNIFDGQQCKDLYAKRGGILDPLAQLCAGGEAGMDSCVGDSGSALMREEKSRLPDFTRQWKLIGVVSFGPRLCGTDGVPGVYTRIRHYMDWILDNTR